jgi:dipeptidase E
MRALLLGPTFCDVSLPVARMLLDGVPSIVLVPFAAPPSRWPALHAELAAALGVEVIDLDSVADPIATVERAHAFAVPAGNTWQLVCVLRRTGLMPALRRRVAQGVPYLGLGAGAVVASPTISTTADPPMCDPQGLDGLHLVPFHVAQLPTRCERTGHGHCGACSETERRLVELTTGIERAWVAGLRPGGGLLIEGRAIEVIGEAPVALFHDGSACAELLPGGVEAGFLLDEGSTRHHHHRVGRRTRCRGA